MGGNPKSYQSQLIGFTQRFCVFAVEVGQNRELSSLPNVATQWYQRNCNIMLFIYL